MVKCLYIYIYIYIIYIYIYIYITTKHSFHVYDLNYSKISKALFTNPPTTSSSTVEK